MVFYVKYEYVLIVWYWSKSDPVMLLVVHKLFPIRSFD